MNSFKVYLLNKTAVPAIIKGCAGFKRLITCLSVAGIILFTGCAPTENTATIRIETGNISTAAVEQRPLIDRFLMLFAREAYAQTAPDGITSLRVRVTGPGMSAVTRTASSEETYIELSVPSGNSRVIEIRAFEAENPEAVYGFTTTVDLEAGEFREIVAVMQSLIYNFAFDLSGFFELTWSFKSDSAFFKIERAPEEGGPYTEIDGEIYWDEEFSQFYFSLNVIKGYFRITALSETDTVLDSKILELSPIVIPDTRGQRIRVINEMRAGTAEQQLEGNSFGAMENFYPTDTGFDSEGRLYAVINTGTYPIYPPDSGSYYNSMIARIDDLSAGSYTQIYPEEGISGEILSFAIDPVSDNIYLIEMNQTEAIDIVRLSPAEPAWEAASFTYDYPEFPPTGLAIASVSGRTYLYAAGGSTVRRFDVTDFENVVAGSSFDMSSPYPNLIVFDILARGSYLYVTAPADPDIYYDESTPIPPAKLLRLSADLSTSVSMNFTTGSPSTQGRVFFPQRFVALHKPEKIYFTDGGGDIYYSGYQDANLIGLREDDMNIAEWDNYLISQYTDSLFGYHFSYFSSGC